MLARNGFARGRDLRCQFGLGKIGKIDAITAARPDGTSERFSAQGADREVTVNQTPGTKDGGSRPKPPVSAEAVFSFHLLCLK
jgi:hypothetical protein